MSSAADIEIWDKACQEFDNGSFEEAVKLFFSMATISAKISFNIGSAYLAANNIQSALKNFQDSVMKDSHLAIGYYMSGLCYSKQSRHKQAEEQFEQTIKCMRGNKCVDYKQLGLKFQLYECEVLMNQAAMHSKLDDINKSKYLLSLAIEVKCEKRHDVINESLKLLQQGGTFEPMPSPNGAIFRPPAHAVKNVKKKDYLGQAKVLYSSDPKDNTAGFSGLKLMQETRQQVLADIRLPGRRESLKPLEEAELARQGDRSRPAPPQKALPTIPIEARERIQTWAGSKPSKPLPRSPIPQGPKRPSDSPSLRKEWDGQKSVHSAFMERSKSPLDNGKPSLPGPSRPPRKPLPSCPSIDTNGTVDTNGHCGNQVDIEVQFNFSVTIKCDEKGTLSDLKKIICQQKIPHSVAIMYIDQLGREKALTDSSLDRILNGSIKNPKLVCSSSFSV